jgi:hypothetical protein
MPISKEYLRYLEAELKKEKFTWFETVCNLFGKFPIPIPISKETEKKVLEQLEFTQTRVKVQSIYSAAIFLALLSVLISIPLFIFNQTLFGILLLASGLGFSYYLTVYPSLNVRYYRIQASSDLVLSVLYMIVSLRIVPSLENALMFAALNITGPVGRSLKKLAWDLGIGKFENADKALEFYSDMWRQENEEFAEAIDIIRTSTLKTEPERNRMYEEAINLLLDRNMERMKKYAAQLTTPVTLINYVGIMLPVLTVILFPVMTIFLTQAIKPTLLIILYNILLPITVYWLMQQTLMTRPFSFSKTDISSHPDAHKIGYYKIKIGKGYVSIPLIPISIIVGGIIIILGILLINYSEDPTSVYKIIGGLTISWGIVMAIILYSYFSYRKNIEIQKEIKEVEMEFTTALYEFGLVLGSGYSVETSLEKLTKKIKNLKISNLFSMALDRIKKFGFTLERAFFDEELGVIKYYPSKLIFNILKILTESLRKGSAATAVAMISISNYLKSVNKVEIYMRELLQESTSEMNFMLTIMVPVACAITIALAALMTNIVYSLSKIFENLTGLSTQVPLASSTMLNVLVNVKDIIPIEWFTIVVSIYMIEIVFIIADYLSRLQYGEDPLEILKTLTSGLTKGMIFLTLISVFVFVSLSGLTSFISPVS